MKIFAAFLCSFLILMVSLAFNLYLCFTSFSWQVFGTFSYAYILWNHYW